MHEFKVMTNLLCPGCNTHSSITTKIGVHTLSTVFLIVLATQCNATFLTAQSTHIFYLSLDNKRRFTNRYKQEMFGQDQGKWWQISENKG